MPSAIQISASNNIKFSGGNYTQFGGGGFGIGNDANAYISEVGLGAQSISVVDGYFTQVMGNSVTLGGVQADAHHPTDSRMINKNLLVSGNIFYNTSSLFTSTVPILSTYIQYSEISNNDLSQLPYSGICHGWGWGANDVGGSPRYVLRGLYNYQPIYNTPTTSHNNVIRGNLIHDYGLVQSDLAGIYTLSKSPGTIIESNFDYGSRYYGIYTDEGSSALLIQNNMFLPGTTSWYHPNQGGSNGDILTTGNNTLIGNYGGQGSDYLNSPAGTGNYGDTFINNYVIGTDAANAPVNGQRTAYRAGVLPGQRSTRPVSNPLIADSHIAVDHDISKHLIRVTISNFEDVAFSGLVFSASISPGFTITSVSVPKSVPGNSFAVATWKLTGSKCTAPVFSVKATYINTRSAQRGTLTSSGTVPGISTDLLGWTASSTWPAQFGSTCDTLGITTSGRDISGSYDDWAALYRPAYIKNQGSITARVNSQDPTNVWTKSGVVVRNSLKSNITSSGYAVLVVTPSEGVSLMWDSTGSGKLNQYTITEGITTPVYLRLTVSASTAVGAYSVDQVHWTQVGSNITLAGRGSALDVGVIHTSHSSYSNATAIFSGFALKNAL